MSLADKVVVARPPVHGLSRSKALAASGFGIVAWLIAALFIRWPACGPAERLEPSDRLHPHAGSDVGRPHARPTRRVAAARR